MNSEARSSDALASARLLPAVTSSPDSSSRRRLVKSSPARARDQRLPMKPPDEQQMRSWAMSLFDELDREGAGRLSKVEMIAGLKKNSTAVEVRAA